MQTGNDQKKYQIEAYPKVLEAIRTEIGQDKIFSIAVPGKNGRLTCTVFPVQTNKIR
jgi:chitinase